jgi:hypothetical protein
MNCDPKAISEAAACYCNLSSKQMQAIIIYLLCQWALAKK